MSKNQFNLMGEEEVAHQETGLSLELSSLKLINKAEIKVKVEAVVTGIVEGFVDPVEALALIKKGKEFFELAEKNVRPHADGRSLGKNYSKFGVKFTETTTGGKTDYSVCEDPIYDGIKSDIAELEKELKEREKFLSGISKPTDIVLNEAEVYNIKPPLKTGKLGYKLEIE